MATIEARLKALEDMISELRDLQAITKLDIINLRNAFEQAKFGIVAELPKAERATKTTEPTEKAEVSPISADELISLISDVGELRLGLEELRNAIGAITVPKIPEVRDWSADIQRLARRITRLDQAIKNMRRLAGPKIAKKDLRARLREIATKDLQKAMKVDVDKISKRLTQLEMALKQLNKRLMDIERQIRL